MSRNVTAVTRNAKLFISRSQNIFENLAFEEWLLRNRKPDEQGESMLLWSNKPSVVIGRHQNPWLEADVKYLNDKSIELARRHSGGGAVYHDLGNLNISILTSHRRHDRKRNLRMIAEALSQKFNIKVEFHVFFMTDQGRTQVEPNERDDLWLQPGRRKISGTAARIVHGVAYHHMTLLVNVDVSVLKRSLSSPFSAKAITNATRSIRAPAVGCLAQEIPGISMEEVQQVLLQSFKKQYMDTEVITLSTVTDDALFHGVRENEKELRSWEWIYGRTPSFTLPLYNDRIRVEHGVITESLESPKLVGTRLPQDILQAYLGFAVKPFLGTDTIKHLADLKAYLRETPSGYDPKIITLQATVVFVLIAALTYPCYSYFTGDRGSSNVVIKSDQKQTI